MSVIALRALATALFLTLPQIVFAQTPSTPAVAPPAAAAVPAPQLLSGPELQALVSPIALYPDALLAEVLMASTYPLEVVEADRWAKANKSLKDEALKSVIDQQKWDESVKSLAATPEVLNMMSDKLDWTQKLGDAVLAQQPDVMDAIQALRQKAQSNNKLASTKQQKVSTQQQGGKEVIVIEPTEPDTIYVPYYDPAVVYGSWPYPSYPPYYWSAPPYIGGALLASGLAFGAGYALGRWTGGGNYWGGGIGWGGGNININRPVNINNIGNNNWTHNPAHRQGVRYNNSNVAQKFGGNRAGNIGGGAQNRLDFRGKGGQQVLNPGGSNRADLGGSRPGGGAGAGDRPGGSKGAASKPSKGGGGADRPGGSKGAASKPSKGGGSANRSGSGGGNRVASRPSGGGGGLSSGSGRSANVASARGQMSMGGGGGGGRGGGGGGRGGGGGGRRSDARLKHDIIYLGRLDDGVGFYRFVYNGGTKAYVGVMAEEVQSIMPDAVTRGRDGYFRVSYGKLGLKFESYDEWIASGARVPTIARFLH